MHCRRLHENIKYIIRKLSIDFEIIYKLGYCFSNILYEVTRCSLSVELAASGTGDRIEIQMSFLTTFELFLDKMCFVVHEQGHSTRSLSRRNCSSRGIDGNVMNCLHSLRQYLLQQSPFQATLPDASSSHC